jgi:hypothetical protein
MIQALKKGWNVAGDNNKIVISRNNCQILFDINIKTAKGVLFATKIERNPEFCGATNHLNKKLELTEKQAHQKLGHMYRTRTNEIAESLGCHIKEKMDVCAPCAEAKARKKNIASNSK